MFLVLGFKGDLFDFVDSRYKTGYALRQFMVRCIGVTNRFRSDFYFYYFEGDIANCGRALHAG